MKKSIIILAGILAASILPVSASSNLTWPVPGHTSLIRGYHEAKAIDIGDSTVGGASVVAACSGTVTDIRKCTESHPGSTGECYGLGTAVIISGSDGRYYTYAHMRAGSIPSGIKYGSEISQGQTLGKVGRTGDADQEHLHFGISVGTAYAWSGINPANEQYDYNVSASEISSDSIKGTSVSTAGFTDVSQSDWYYTNVTKARSEGLITGTSETTFEPDGTLTYAQAIAMAARLNQRYLTGSCTLTNGTVNWYDTYVQYCYDKDIIGKEMASYGSSMMNSQIDRATYVGIFAKALPESEFKEMNTIRFGSIPDVNQTTVNWQSIYMFYRAGILNGSDEKGSFLPYTNIKRSEVATILVRMIDSGSRVSVSL